MKSIITLGQLSYIKAKRKATLGWVVLEHDLNRPTPVHEGLCQFFPPWEEGPTSTVGAWWASFPMGYKTRYIPQMEQSHCEQIESIIATESSDAISSLDEEARRGYITSVESLPPGL